MARVELRMIFKVNNKLRNDLRAKKSMFEGFEYAEVRYEGLYCSTKDNCRSLPMHLPNSQKWKLGWEKSGIMEFKSSKHPVKNL